MSVYVDGARIPFRRMLMSHMMADTRRELDAMADAIGVARRWRQRSGNYGEHDTTRSKRSLAVKHGAIEVDVRFLVDLELGWRVTEGMLRYFEAAS